MRSANADTMLERGTVTIEIGGVERYSTPAASLAPPDGLEPPTRWLTASCSTD